MTSINNEDDTLPYYDVHMNTVEESKPLPTWVRKILFKSLGIKTHEKDKPIFATFLYMLTLTSAITYSVTDTWYTCANVKSRNTKFDVLSGSVNLALTYGFCGIALYANQLAYKLFTSKVLVDSVRLHSKTVFKVNVGVLILVLGLVFIGLYDYQIYSNFKPDHCKNVSTPVIICHIMYPSHVTLSAFCLLWNLLVGIICLSVCRTHTHSIRRFLMELDLDVMAYDLRLTKKNKTESIDETDDAKINPIDQKPTINEPEADHDQGMHTKVTVNPQLGLRKTLLQTNRLKPRHLSICQSTQDIEMEWDQVERARRRRSVAVLARSFETQSFLQRIADAAHPPLPEYVGNHFGQSIEEKSTEEIEKDDIDGVDMDTHEISMEMLTNEEILNKYWKLQCRLRTTSMYLQRWLASWIVLLISWSVFYLVYWIDHNATISDMVIFFIPLICLPLLCSAPTEVNGEGQRVAKSIVPTQERMQLIGFIRNSPLSITIFGMSLNYATVVGAIVAIALAFATKVIVAEV